MCCRIVPRILFHSKHTPPFRPSLCAFHFHHYCCFFLTICPNLWFVTITTTTTRSAHSSCSFVHICYCCCCLVSFGSFAADCCACAKFHPLMRADNSTWDKRKKGKRCWHNNNKKWLKFFFCSEDKYGTLVENWRFTHTPLFFLFSRRCAMANEDRMHTQ